VFGVFAKTLRVGVRLHLIHYTAAVGKIRQGSFGALPMKRPAENAKSLSEVTFPLIGLLPAVLDRAFRGEPA
jgi:hypothetical protein